MSVTDQSHPPSRGRDQWGTKRSLDSHPLLPAAALVMGTAAATSGLHLLSALACISLVGAFTAAICGARRSAVGRVLAFGLVAGLAAQYATRQPPALLAAAGAALALCVLPFRIWPLSKSDVLPLPHMFGLVVAAYVVVGSLVARTDDSLVPLLSENARVSGLLLTAVFLAVVLVGTAVGLRRPRRRSRTSIVGVGSVDRFLILIVAAYLALFIVDVTGLRASLGAIPVSINSLRLMGIVGIFGAYLRGMAGARWLVVVCPLVVLEVVVGLGSGAIYSAARAPLAMLILYVCLRRRVPWLLLVVSVLAALVLNTTKGEFRNDRSAQTGPAANQGVEYLRRVTDSASATSDATLSVAAARFAYSTSDLMGYVATNVPDQYSHWGSTSYRNLPLTVVPRFLFPGKPNFNFGNQFGRTYGLLGQSDLSTAENLPLAVEAYVSFGIVGLLFIGLALGLLFAAICRRFGDGTFSSAVIGTVMISALIQGVESDSTLVIGQLPLLLLVMPPVLRWAARKHEGAPA